jgi:Flp pilus assembly pilin Flp
VITRLRWNTRKTSAVSSAPPEELVNIRSVWRRAAAPFGLLRNLWLDEEGQDLVEYVLLLGFIVVTAMGVMTSLRVEISGIWSTITSSLSSAVASS